jgi:hypothetical protein
VAKVESIYLKDIVNKASFKSRYTRYPVRVPGVVLASLREFWKADRSYRGSIIIVLFEIRFSSKRNLRRWIFIRLSDA